MFRLSRETMEDITAADLGPPTWTQFIKAYFLYPQFYVIYMWKLARRNFDKGPMRRLFAKLILLRLFTTVNCVLPPHAKIGRRIHFPHPYGIALGINCEIGDDVTIFQMVTVGRNDDVNVMPKIGNGVTIFTGAIVQGGITVGDHAIIGANAVVTKNVPPYAVVAGAPAKILKYQKPAS